jgi:hypothetical protein
MRSGGSIISNILWSKLVKAKLMPLVNVDEVHWHTLAWRRLVGKTLPVTHGFENRLFSADQSHTPAWRQIFSSVYHLVGKVITLSTI